MTIVSLWTSISLASNIGKIMMNSWFTLEHVHLVTTPVITHQANQTTTLALESSFCKMCFDFFITMCIYNSI